MFESSVSVDGRVWMPKGNCLVKDRHEIPMYVFILFVFVDEHTNRLITKIYAVHHISGREYFTLAMSWPLVNVQGSVNARFTWSFFI